jgi:hypothetical protein
VAKTKRVIPTGGVADVEISGDSRAVDLMMAGLTRAFGPAAITYNLLQDRVYPILEERATERFQEEGDEVVGKWSPLKPYTQEQRAKGGFGPAGPINVRTGALKAHVLERPPDVVPNTLGGTLWFPKRGGAGKSLKKVQTAQMGDPKTRTVPRPVLGVGLQDMELILIAVGVHIAQNQHGVAGGGMF